jgi:hypothetical protein
LKLRAEVVGWFGSAGLEVASEAEGLERASGFEGVDRCTFFRGDLKVARYRMHESEFKCEWRLEEQQKSLDQGR